MEGRTVGKKERKERNLWDIMRSIAVWTGDPSGSIEYRIEVTHFEKDQTNLVGANRRNATAFESKVVIPFPNLIGYDTSLIS